MNALNMRHSDNPSILGPRSAPKLTQAQENTARARGSDRNRMYGCCCINAFLLFGWVLSISQFVEYMVDERARKMVNQIGGAGYSMFLVAAVYFYERKRRSAVPLWSGYVYLFLISIVLLVIRGLFIANAPRVVGFDLMTFGTIFGVFVLGRREEVWDDVQPIIMALTGVSIVMALAYTDRHVLVERGILNEEIGSQFETGLILAPLFCIATFFDRKVWRYYIFLLLSAGCFFVYLYFGRRGISVRCAAELLIATVVLPVLAGSLRRAFVAGALAVCLGIALVAYFPFDTLIGRFQGTYGVLSTVTIENERWEEARILFEEFRAMEFLFGRGVGGAFAVNQSGWLILDRIDEIRSGRYVVHAGALYPFLKGGATFCLVYFLPIFVVFSRVLRWRQLDSITVGTLAAGVVFLGFQLVEGAPTYMAPWVSFGIGMIMSRAQNAVSTAPWRDSQGRLIAR